MKAELKAELKDRWQYEHRITLLFASKAHHSLPLLVANNTMHIRIVPNLLLLATALLSQSHAQEDTVTSDPTSCEVSDMRGNVVLVADGNTLTTEAFCRHNYEATNGEKPSEIVRTTVLCTNGISQDVSDDVQTCPEDEPECYDLDQYTEEEWEPKCISTSDTTSSAERSRRSMHVNFAVGIFVALISASLYAS